MKPQLRETRSIGNTSGLCFGGGRASFVSYLSVDPGSRDLAERETAVFMYASQTISGAALAAFLPTFTSENGFTGANAQIATLAPYGSAAVAMIVLSYASDRVGNRGHFVNFGFVFMVAGFGIYLGVPASNHAARFAALIMAETGHYSE